MKQLIFDYKTEFDEYAQNFRQTKVGSVQRPGQIAYVADIKKHYILTNNYTWQEYPAGSSGFGAAMSASDTLAICT